MLQTIVAGRWNKHSSDRKETRDLWRIRNQHDAGRVDLKALADAQDLTTKLLLKELEETGATIICDGGIRWDSLYDGARKIGGCGGFEQLTVIPETNHFHRQPIAHLPLFYREPILLPDFCFAKTHTKKPLVCSLPGPYSLAKHTQNVQALGLRELAFEYAKVLRREISSILEDGAEMVRVVEPQVFAPPFDFDLFTNLAATLLSGIDRSRVAIATYFRDIVRPKEYFALPFGLFFVDFVEGRNNIEALLYFPPDKKLVAGIFDARQPYTEREEELKAKLKKIFRYVDKEKVAISSHTDFHFLQWNVALEKVQRMVSFANTAQNKRVRPSRNEPGGNRILEDINFITSAVGSYPQNNEIRQARAQLRRGEIDENSYRESIAKHTRQWMEFQHEIDLTVPVSGEFLREDMAAYFGVQLGGRLLDFVPSYENRRYRPVEYYRKVSAEGPITVDDFRFVQSLTKRPVKATLTGPVTLTDWALLSDQDYYHNPGRLRMDLGKALRNEVRHLIPAGLQILQVDEPALTKKMTNFFEDITAITETIRDFKNLYLVLHICYSDMRALDEAFPYIIRLPFHQIHMEMANRNYAMLDLIQKHGFGGKDIGLGVIDVHTDRIETVDEIVSGVEKTLKYFHPKQIWLTPDCGLKERNDEVAKAKLKVMTEAAKICREKFAAHT